MQPGEMNIDPIEAEFFSTEALGSLADALVREAVQNSLDARVGTGPLKMRIYFSSAEAMLDGGRRAAYVADLAPHLNASRSGLMPPDVASEPLSFLTIEDFGTRGLQGDPAQSEDDEIEQSGLRNDFFYFWRNIGRSRKQASDLGRWGLGKTVFQAASRLNAFFGLSVRANDARRVLLGQAVLKIHKLDGQRYYPYGYYGSFDRDFALPVADEAHLERFCRDFRLARRSAPGLSVVIPYPDAELTPQAVISSIVHHYFMPLIAGALVVEVVHGGKSQMLDGGTLSRHVEAGGADDSLENLFELARWGVALPREAHARLGAPPVEAAPRWSDERVHPDDLARLREQFDADERVAVTVPVWVKPVDAEPVLSEFDVYVERDERLTRAEEHFVRDGITIAGVRASLPSGNRVIVAVHDRPLATLLGDSENPAHTEWQERSPKFRNRYRHGPFTLRYLKSVPRELVRLLTRPTEGRDFKLLRQLFSLDVPTEAALNVRVKTEDHGKGAGETAGGDGVETVGRDRQFQLVKLVGGFRITGHPNGDGTSLPKHVAVQVAYDVRRGNPFTQYQPLDFALDEPPIEVDAGATSIALQTRNVLVLAVEDAPFDVTVKGFDRHRDIRVKVLPVEEARRS